MFEPRCLGLTWKERFVTIRNIGSSEFKLKSFVVCGKSYDLKSSDFLEKFAVYTEKK